MQLKEYLKSHNLTCKSFAEKIAVSGAQITDLIKKKTNPSAHLIYRILNETKGEVGFEDLFNPDLPTKLKNKPKSRDGKD